MACVLALAIVLAACAPGVAPESSPSVGAVPEDSPEPATSSDPAAEQEGDGHSCTDPAGDGGTNDLTDVALALDGQYLTVTFELAQPVPTNDFAMVGVNVITQTSDDPGYEMHQLGVKWNEGRMIGFFDFNFDTARQDNFDYSGVTVTGNQVSAKWPASIIEGLGDDWRWFAFVTHEGTDTDACPGEPLSFQTLTYKD
jgi:hypothetical protein